MFSYTTGGPFGLEDMVTTSGPGMTLIYLLVLPFFWCIPVSLVSAELTTAMPVQGGFYRWARAAFGDFWGFLAGWWNWSASFLLGGVYAVLFADYLSNYFPQITGWKHYLVSLALIAIITWINLRGIQMVGQVATALEIFIFLPVVTMVAIGLAKWQHNPFVPVVVPRQPPFKIFGVGLALGLWLYSGYEQLSTVAEEVEDPQRSYPRALALVVPLSIATYFLPTLTGLAALGDWQNWHTGHFSEVATLIGQYRAAQQHRPHHHPHAFRHGRRRLPARRSHPQASRLRHAVAGHRSLGDHLRSTGAPEPHPTHLRLYLVALRHDGADGAVGMETSPDSARDATLIRDTGRKCGALLCGSRAPGDGNPGPARQ